MENKKLYMASIALVIMPALMLSNLCASSHSHYRDLLKKIRHDIAVIQDKLNKVEKTNNSAKELLIVNSYYRDLLSQKIKAQSLIKEALVKIVDQQYLVNKTVQRIEAQLERFYSRYSNDYKYDASLTKDCESLERDKEKAQKDFVELRELYWIYTDVYKDLSNEIECLEIFY